MSVSWFSVFILLILFSSVLIEAVRGYRRGFVRSAISLGVTVASLMLSVLITWRVSDIPAATLADFLNNLSAIQKVQPDLPTLSTLIETYADALLSPFLFVLLYVPVRALLAVLSQVLIKGQTPTEAQVIIMRGLAARVAASETNKTVTADILSRASRNWLKGEPYLNVKKPTFGEYIDPVFDAMLKACSRTTPETVAPNIATLMNVYLILYENGLLHNTNSSEVQKKLGDDQILSSLLAELDANPAMAGVADAIRDAAMRAMVHKLQSEIAGEAYDKLMQQLTDSINSLSGMPHDVIVNTMTEHALQYIKDYGIDVSSGTVQMVVEGIVSDMEGAASGTITPEELEDLLKAMPHNSRLAP